MITIDYIGKGLVDPFTNLNGEPAKTEGLPMIEQSIKRILGEKKGTRFFNSAYGSRIDEIMFQPNDDVVFDLLRVFIVEAVREWEKRAEIVSVESSRASVDQVNSVVTVRVLNSNEVHSFVFPFYTNLIN